MTHDVVQGYDVYRQGEYTVAQGQMDGTVLVREKDASPVLQAALNALEGNGGGELKITSGLYLVDQPLQLPSRVTVSGSGRATILKLGEDNAEGVILLADTREGIVVSDMVLQGIPSHDASAGVILDSAGDSKVRNVYARDFSGYGIWLRNGSFMCELLNNTTSANVRAGVFLQAIRADGRGGFSVPNLVAGCISYGETGHGIELEASTCQNLVGCLAFQPKGHGFYFHSHSCSNVLTGSRCFMGYQNGVMLDWAPESNISSNIFCWNRGHGIEMRNVTWGTVCGNEFIDSGGVVDYEKDGFGGRTHGVYLHTDTKGVQITGNAIFVWGDGHAPMKCGVYEADDCRDNQIANNVVNYYTDEAVCSAGVNSAVGSIMGVRKFYTEPWLGPFQPEKDEPTQLLQPFTGRRVAEFLNGTRK